jgi:hypothetical protein
VQFLRGTILHLSSKAHLQGEERMSLWEVIAFLEAQSIERKSCVAQAQESGRN